MESSDTVTFTGSRVQWAWPDASGFVTDYLQGLTVADVSGVPGGTYSYVLTEDYFAAPLTNGQIYYLSCFAHNEAEDDWSAAADSAQDSAIPMSADTIPALSGIPTSDFECGVGWGTSCVIFDLMVGGLEIPLIPNGEVS